MLNSREQLAKKKKKGRTHKINKQLAQGVLKKVLMAAGLRAIISLTNEAHFFEVPP